MADEKRLLLIDGNSIINRSFYAMAGRNPLSAPDGTPTAAVNTYLNTLARYISEVKPTHTLTLFDRKEPTFRHLSFDGYKAKRKSMPDDLRVQMPILKEVLDALSFPRYELAGYEADDLIGTYKTLAVADGFKVFILSGDKDDFQLIDEQTVVVMPVSKAGQTSTDWYDISLFNERFGIEPQDFVTAKAIMGDNSDNIPGAAGIGEKGAMNLVSKYKTLDDIYAHLDEFPKGIQQKMRDSEDMVRLSYKLSAILLDAPVTLPLCDLAMRDTDTVKAADVLTRYGFRSQLKKWGIDEESQRNARITAPNDADDSALIPGEDQKNDMQRILDYSSLTEPQITLESSTEILSKALLVVLKGVSYAIDIFAIDGHPCLAMAWQKDDVRVWSDIDVITDVMQTLFQWEQEYHIEPVCCSLKNAAKNMPFLLPFTSCFDVEIVGLVQNRVSGNEPPFEMLFEHSTKIPFPFLPDYEEKTEKKTKTQMSLEDLMGGADSSPEEAEGENWTLSLDEQAYHDQIVRRAYRVLFMRMIHDVQVKDIEANHQEKLIYEIEMPLVLELYRMERRGVYVDEEMLDSLHITFDEKIHDLEQEIYLAAGEVFSILSPKQLSRILFEKLGLPSGRKNHGGSYSTDSDELDRLSTMHPIVPLILQYRQYAKLDSTFVMGLKKNISPIDGRIHTTYSQAMTNTGRLSSSEPNLQNIPIRSDLGGTIRKAFVAPEGYVLLDADYSQIELRLLAAISGDSDMIQGFQDGEDIHSMTAMKIFGLPKEMIDASMRAAAKRINFSIVYGVSDFGLSQDLGISIPEAHRYIEQYYAKYPAISPCLKGFIESGKKNGYVDTMFGRRRILHELSSANRNIRNFGERAAMNTPIQGTAADIIKLAMVRASRSFQAAEIDAKLILQVHDELIVEVSEKDAATAAILLEDAMENAVDLAVKLPAEVHQAKSWFEAH